jgi:hypothetical protein
MFEMKTGRRCVGAALWTAFGVELAVAQTFHVKEADFDKGEWSVESINASQHRFPVNADRIPTAHELGLGYGISAFWQLKGLISFHSPEDESVRFQRGLIENIFVIRALPKERNGISTAWFQSLEVALDPDETNATTFGPILLARSGKLELALNPFFAQTFGQNREEGIAFVYGWQLRHEITKNLSFGVEGYGKIPDVGSGTPLEFQEHRIGPVLIVETELEQGRQNRLGTAGVGAPMASSKSAVALEFGVLFGMTDATADVTGKANLHFTF